MSTIFINFMDKIFNIDQSYALGLVTVEKKNFDVLNAYIYAFCTTNILWYQSLNIYHQCSIVLTLKLFILFFGIKILLV